MGTPTFAVPSLEKIYKEHEIISVFTKVDNDVKIKAIVTSSDVQGNIYQELIMMKIVKLTNMLTNVVNSLVVENH